MAKKTFGVTTWRLCKWRLYHCSWSKFAGCDQKCHPGCNRVHHGVPATRCGLLAGYPAKLQRLSLCCFRWIPIKNLGFALAYSGSCVVPRCLGGDNKEANGEFFRSRTVCSLESSSNRITCRGDQRVRMIYHSRSSLLTAAADLAVANFDRSRSAKSRTSPGSFLRTKAILRCKSILRESTFW